MFKKEDGYLELYNPWDFIVDWALMEFLTIVLLVDVFIMDIASYDP